MKTWKEWTKLHGNLFGLVDSRDGEMLATWAALFAGLGHGPAELAEASQWLAANNAPSFRTDHLKALQGRLRAVREAREAEARTEAPDASSCRLCHGCGRVSVPCPDAFKAGKFGTFSVLCRCPLGLWVWRNQQEHFPRHKPPRQPQMTLLQYEGLHGDGWREMRAEMDRRVKAELDAARQASEADRDLGKLAMPRAFRDVLHGAKGGERG